MTKIHLQSEIVQVKETQEEIKELLYLADANCKYFIDVVGEISNRILMVFTNQIQFIDGGFN